MVPLWPYRSDACSVWPSAGANTPCSGKNFTSGSIIVAVVRS